MKTANQIETMHTHTSGLYLDDSAGRFMDKPDGLGAIYANLKWGTDAAFSVNVWLHEKPSAESCVQCDQMAVEVIRRWNAHSELLDALQMVLEIGDQCSRGYLGKVQSKARAAIARATEATK